MAARQLDITQEDRALLELLIYRLTGAQPETQPKLETCLVNIERRVQALGLIDLRSYLEEVETRPEELAQFLSAITIHTTSWFREMPHFDRLAHFLNSTFRGLPVASTGVAGEKTIGGSIRVLSAGCSSGEELFSLALTLEDIRQKNPGFDYLVEGIDIDPVSVARANKAIYQASVKNEIPSHLHRYLMLGSGRTKGLLTLSKDVRSRCSAKRGSLLDLKAPTPFNVIFCRNVLIYFGPEAVKKIIGNLVHVLSPNGILCLGHSESTDPHALGLEALGHATYKKFKASAATPSSSVASQTPQQTPGKLVRQAPAAAKPRGPVRKPDIILVGASTGGTDALIKLLHDLPRPFPPLLVVQHIAIAFARQFARRLAESSGLTLAAPVHGTMLEPNHLYMAQGDYHIGVTWRGGIHRLEITHGPLIHGVRPSVDILFQSMARAVDTSAVMAVLMTGMGKDGAKGMSELFARGSMTLVQDEASSIVFGMPKEAISLGAARFIGSPSEIRQQILTSLKL